MYSHDTEPSTDIIVETYDIPDEADWQSLDDVPLDFVQIVELQQMALNNGETIEDVVRGPVDLDTILETRENWLEDDAHIVVARDDEGAVIGMLSYYFLQQKQPFIDSAAVDPDIQRAGVLTGMMAAALEELRSSGAEFVHLRAQARVASIYERKWAAEVIKVDQNTGRVLMRISIQ